MNKTPNSDETSAHSSTPLQNRDFVESPTSCPEENAEPLDTFGEMCIKLMELIPKATIMLAMWMTTLYGLLRNHFDMFVVPGYGWIIGLLAFVCIGVVLLFGVMEHMKQISERRRKGRFSKFRAFVSSIFALAILYAVLYCAGAQLVGIEKLHSRISASASKQTIQQ